MFILKVHDIELQKDKNISVAKPKNVFLEIYSEGHTRRRYFVGRFDNSNLKNVIKCKKITHLTAKPITIHASYGALLRNNLGFHTLYEFLSEDFSTKKRKLSFGFAETYVVSYSITKVNYSYDFFLNDAKCLQNVSWLKDQLYAEVEFDKSPQSIETHNIPVNTYHLGSFKTVAKNWFPSVHLISSKNLLITSMTSFTITFYLKSNLRAKVILGEVNFYPLLNKHGEIRFKYKGQSSLILESNDIFADTVAFNLPYEDGLYQINFTIQKKKIDSNFNDNLNYLNLERKDQISDEKFSNLTENNELEILVDGDETFEKYFDVMSRAKHSISILAWELYLNFPLIENNYENSTKNFIPLQNILIKKALQGVKIRIIVWRHELISKLTKFVYFTGKESIEKEVLDLDLECKKNGLKFKVFETVNHIKGNEEKIFEEFNFFDRKNDTNIAVVIVGNPQGLLSSHHEKLILVDSECPENTVAFLGGYDMAKGRHGNKDHKISIKNPIDKLSFSKNSNFENDKNSTLKNYEGIILWHDIQIFLKGSITKNLTLHFCQRWLHCFFPNEPEKIRSLKIPNSYFKRTCKTEHEIIFEKKKKSKQKDNLDSNIPFQKNLFKNIQILPFRIWTGFIDNNLLFDEFCSIISNAKNSLYFEHQYPFHNFGFAYYMCEALKKNLNLKVIIVTPVKTDLPTGIVGELFDWSQDQILQNLNLIFSVAPDRVGIYGLVQQNKNTNEIKPIYVHSKLLICDDEIINLGSSNMDTMSFIYSSELNVKICDKNVVSNIKTRLLTEHLGENKFTEDLNQDFSLLFDAFKNLANENEIKLKEGRRLIGRVVHLMPSEKYLNLLQIISTPSKFSKLMFKLGLISPKL